MEFKDLKVLFASDTTGFILGLKVFLDRHYGADISEDYYVGFEILRDYIVEYGKSKALEFAGFLGSNCEPIPINTDHWRHLHDGENKSPQQLYQIFKQQTGGK